MLSAKLLSAIIQYLLHDEFVTNRAAGAVSGTLAQPGPGVRTASSANVSITNNELVETGTGTWTDTYLYYQSGFSRKPGRILKSKAKISSGMLAMFGFRTDQNSSQIGFNNVGLYANTTNLLVRRTSDGTSPAVRALLTASYYDFYTVLRATGKFIFTNSDIYPVLDWIDDWSSAATVYAGASVLTSAQSLTHDTMAVGNTTWLPTPLVSQGFGGTFGTSDGLGHAEGVAGGIGAGGSGVTLSQSVGTWANSAGKSGATALSSGVAVATASLSTPHVVATVKTTRSAGTVGVVVRYVDASNYVYSVHNGTQVNLRKVLAGVDSQVLAPTSATYAVNAEHRIICDGQKFRVFYNGMSIGAEQTISDTALQSGTGVGLYTTDTGNQFDDLNIYARGLAGEYSALPGFFVHSVAQSNGDDWQSTAATMALTPSQSLYVHRVSASFYHTYRHLGGNYWLDNRLDDLGSSTPFSFTRATIREAIAIVLSKAASGVTYSGTWAARSYSSDPETYMAGALDSTVTVNSYVETSFTVSATGDVYAVVSKASNGNYIKAELDGDTNNCNELPITGGYHYIDTYNASTVHKKVIKVASNVPIGPHTLRLTLMSDKHASSSGNAFYFNGIAYTVANPSQATWRAPGFQATTAYSLYDQIEVESRNYYCSTAGTSGASAPTHTSGAVANGSATFTYMAKNSYGIRNHMLHSVSQVEYAYEVKPSGASASQDVGGRNHGNETRESATWYVDGNSVTLTNGEFQAATSEIRLEQVIHATHTEVVGNVTDTTLKHIWTSDKLKIQHAHTWKKVAAVGFFLPTMWPALVWSSESNQYWADKMAIPSFGTVNLPDYYGQSVYIGRRSDYIQATWGDLNFTHGVGGQPSAESSTHTALTLVKTTPQSVNSYLNSSFKANILTMQSIDVPPSANDVRAKQYFERVPSSSPVDVAVNEVWTCEAEYYSYLITSPTIVFPPA